MSDVAKCPYCQKYIDVTFGVENCPKCKADVRAVDFSPSIDPSKSMYQSSYLGLSIVSFLFCGLGLIAIVMSILAISAANREDYASALSYAENAKTLSIVSLVIGGILFFLAIIARMGAG